MKKLVIYTEHWQKFRFYYQNIVFPSLIGLILFILLIFMVILPSLEKRMIDMKKQTIRELNLATWSILNIYYMGETAEKYSWQEAMKMAKMHIEFTRYGKENKDYFWIIDQKCNLVIHPYRKDLENKNMWNYRDSKGNYLFREALNAVKDSGEGYIKYIWQWKDRPNTAKEKISHVKLFEPWGWIIGTGIYIEDVHNEIRRMTNKVVIISVIIVVIIGMIIIYIIRHGLKTEKQKQLAERSLKDTKDRYQALAEAASEGTILWLDDHRISANKHMQTLTGFSETEFSRLSIFDIISKDQIDSVLGEKYFKHLAAGITQPKQFEAQVRRKNGGFIKLHMVCSVINLGDQTGVIITAKDIKIEKSIQKKLGLNRGRYDEIIRIFDTGVFRSTIGDSPVIVECNQAFKEITGYRDEKELFSLNFFNFVVDEAEKNTFLQNLLLAGEVKNRILRIIRKDNEIAIVRVSSVLVNDSENNLVYFDSVVEDQTLQRKKESEQETLIVELQAYYHLLNNPVGDYSKEFITCKEDVSIIHAVSVMVKNKRNAIFIMNDQNECTGIVTNHDLREKVMMLNLSVNNKIGEIKSWPVVTIPNSALLYEAIMKMKSNNISSLGVLDDYGKISRIITIYDVYSLQQNSSTFILNEIRNAQSPENLVSIGKQIHLTAGILMESGAKANILTKVISDISDALTLKFGEFAINELGQPPVPFAFVVVGSEGRHEQSLCTDQDNGIIFEDSPENHSGYFLQLADYICRYLNKAGFHFCMADLMAMNPKWNQPLTVWKDYYSKWIRSIDSESVFDAGIFFDMRLVFGDVQLVNDLKTHISTISGKHSGFYKTMMEGVLKYKPPVNLFGKIIFEPTAKYQNALDSKKLLMPVVFLVRIFALKYHFSETNTLDRLHKMFELNLISKNTFLEIEQAYNFLMLMRFKAQFDSINAGFAPDNLINASNLTEIELSTLKRILSEISSFINKTFDIV